MVANLTMTFVNTDYAKHREDVLFDREMAMMPQTVIYAEIHKKISELTRERTQLREELTRFRRKNAWGRLLSARNIVRSTIDEEDEASYKYFDIEVMIETLKLKIKRADVMIRRLQARNLAGNAEVTPGTYVRGCPTPNCRGFLGTDWTCAMCKSVSCDKCHVIIDQGGTPPHVCDDNDVKTAALLVNDTKSCPKCATPIFKVDGCDQIWCTQCHIAFSWRTGHIETGRIHNPHYYEYLRKRNNGHTARELGDIPCGGLPTVYQVTKFMFQQYLAGPTDQYNKLHVTAAVSIADTILNDMIPVYLANATQNADANRDLRVAYICNETNKDDLKKALRKREKMRLKHDELAHVLNAFVMVIADITRNMCQSATTIQDTVKEIDEVVVFTDDALVKIGARYQSARISVKEMMVKLEENVRSAQN